MNSLTPLTALVAALLVAQPLSQQAATSNQTKTAPNATVLSLIGCVERVSPAAPARGTTQPAPERPVYKLIDVQPGASTRATLKAESQFLLAVSTSLATPIDPGKFQNQWVEVSGTITAAPASVPPARPGPQSATRPAGETATSQLPTFTLTSLKVVSTECK